METLKELKHRLKSKVGKNTTEAINDIERELRTDSGFYSEVIICKNKNNSIQTDYHKGIITDAERGLQQARLLDSVLALIDKLEERDLLSFKENGSNERAPGADRSAAGNLYKNDKAAPRKKAPVRLFIETLLGGTRREIITSLLLLLALIFLGRNLLPASTGENLPRTTAPGKAGEGARPAPEPDSYSPSDFEVIERRTVIDFRAWKKVPKHLMQTERVEPQIWHQSLKIEKRGESKTFIARHISDGYTLDFACISQECTKRPPVQAETKEGAVQYKIFQIEFDVSKYVVGEQFTIEYQAVYWNANQKEEYESVSVIASNPTKLIILDIYFPDFVQDDLFFRYAKREENINYIKFQRPNAKYKNKHLEWRIENPSLDVFYGVQWNWKV